MRLLPSNFFFKVLLLLCFVQSPFFYVNGQKQNNRKELEQNKRLQLKKIKEATIILSQTRKTKKSTLGQLNALNSLIKARQEYANILQEELTKINASLQHLIDVRMALRKNLETLKQEYANTLYDHAKYIDKSKNLFYFLSFSKFSELYNKIKALEFYRDESQLQAKEIMVVNRTLDKKKEAIMILQRAKNKLYFDTIKERGKLQKSYEEQAQKRDQLIADEAQIKASLKKRKKEVKRLNLLITKAVEEEIELLKRSSLAFKATLKKSSLSFEKKKGRLGWPVSGFIVNPFGKHPHRTLKNVTVNNMGIGIQTKTNESVVAVHKGIVVQTVDLPSLGLAIIIQHGNYYTVYSKVKNIRVVPGDTVKEGQKIAEVHDNHDGDSELEFMVWNNVKKENPELWLKK